MLAVDVGLWGRMVCVSVTPWSEKSIVCVKHLATQQLEPLSSETTSILALLLSELDL